MEDDKIKMAAAQQIDQWVGSFCGSAKYSQDNSASSIKSTDIKQALKRKMHKVPVWKHTQKINGYGMTLDV